MSDDRNRINVTLSDNDLFEIKEVASFLGIKPTRVVYECLKVGLPTVLKNGQDKLSALTWAKHRKRNEQRSWVQEDLIDSVEIVKPEKAKSFQQKKVEARRAKKKKSR